MKFGFKSSLLIVLLFACFQSSEIKSQSFVDVEFTRAIIDGEIYLKPLPQLINAKFGSAIKLYFDTINGENYPKVKFNIYLNGKLINEDYTEYFYDLNNLSKSTYIIKVVAVVGEKERGSAIKRIVISDKSNSLTEEKPINVEKEELAESNLIEDSTVQNTTIETPKETEKPAESDSSGYLIYILIGIVIIQSGAIGFLLLKKKNESDKKEPVQKSSVDEETYQLMKKGFVAMERQNRELKSKVKKMAKIKNQLEDANLNLLDQKEKLEDKKNELELMSEKKDDLVASALHDIKNPASAIHGLIELLNKYDLSSQEQQEIMETLVNSSTRVLKLAQEISDSFAQQDYENKLKMVSGNINDSVNNIIKLNFARATKKKMTIVKETTDIPKFLYDNSKIEEVIDNLLNNAIKYSPQGTDVTIVTKREEDKVFVSVKDTGVGIPKEELPKIFDKGVKLSPKPTGGESSSGLGMWIVKRIVDEHKGRVWAKSKVGEGSEFGFELPMKSTN